MSPGSTSSFSPFYILFALILLMVSGLGAAATTTGSSVPVPTSGPIIGVLAEEITSESMQKFATSNTSSFITASYIKWIESGGGRAVPITLNQPDSYYNNLISKLNGLVFPGGAASLHLGGYAKAGKVLYGTAQTMNQQGNYFPIWGTCLGFELLSTFTADRGNILGSCSAENISLPVSFQNGYKTSKMLASASTDILSMLAKEPITANNHKKCLAPTNFTANGLNTKMNILATSVSQDNVVFVAMVEDSRYPFYGVQFHSEKPQFESHHPSAGAFAAHAVQAGQYFANFLVSEAKKNKQRFANKEEEDKYSIHSYKPIPARGTIYDEIYVFN
ncbi:gamma-glutamyl hydrolase-like [Paramacrobiotus metropolitanus]|uniref:gamma-glutamyl hydrolase-like n=1 Tax=Paramacrobiotus metropolitanus TaxID=2943436 RepID=UPI0024464E36|nr:gamma-glutamyl hydrolase-like [Paramacrobiotus metropolitanus]